MDNIFNVLNKSNENIMEYFSPPMQSANMQQPMMAFSQPSYPIQRPIPMPTRSSEKSRSKDDDDDLSDFMMKLLAAGAIGGGGMLAYQHFKPSPLKQTASELGAKALQHIQSELPGRVIELKQHLDTHDRLDEKAKQTLSPEEYAKYAKGYEVDNINKHGPVWGSVLNLAQKHKVGVRSLLGL